MEIDWLYFTPGRALAGGALIGLAAGVLILANGRIAGISGILAGLHEARAGDAPGEVWGWRSAFLVGLLVPAVLLSALGFHETFAPAFGLATAADWGRLLVAGVLVGFGTRLASGCTSGHGVCGLARLSPRSLAAVLSFMGAGMVTVWLLRAVLPGGAP